MAKLYKRPETPYFWCWFWHEGKRVRKSTNTADKRTAEKVALQLEREYEGKEAEARKGLTLEEGIKLVDKELGELAKVGKKSTETHRYHRKCHKNLLRVLGAKLPVSQLTAAKVDQFISKRREEGVKEHTIQKDLVSLRVVLKSLKRKELYELDIFKVLPDRFQTDYKPRVRTLSRDELNTILDKAKPERRAYIAFAVATGARLSELERVRKEDIQDTGNGTFMVGLRGTKTDKSNRDGSAVTRYVPIVTEWQKAMLKIALENQEKEGELLLKRWVNPSTGMRVLAGQKELGLPKFSPNDLRRTFATWLRLEGIELSIIAAAMGHKSSMMVERVYGRLSPSQLMERMQKATKQVA